MKKYQQLTQEQRYHIYALRKTGHSQHQIATDIGVHKTTISRELRRNRGLKGYRPQQAHQFALKRRHDAYKAHKMTPELRTYIDNKLTQEQWSPQQISGWLARERSCSISHERIYQHILTNKERGGCLYQHLRQSHKKRKKRYGKVDKRGLLPDRQFIDKRPQAVADKQRYGDWEVDTIIGRYHQGAIVTIVERKSQFVLMKRLAAKTAELTSQAIKALLGPLKELCYTVTSDNGKEFAYHQDISHDLGSEFYFAEPYCSWQRGLNEQVNGLIRQYLPKKTDFRRICEKQVNLIMHKLNHRPRKSLGYRTPMEVLCHEAKLDSRKLQHVALMT